MKLQTPFQCEDRLTNRGRRQVLAFAAGALLLLEAASRAAAAEAACYDPDALPLSQKSRRRSLNYRDQSGDPARHCSACNFFTAAGAGCGTCAMLGGGSVNAGGVCDSFAAKSAKP